MIRISSEGPTVSFKGSPTVSPTTAASCAGEPLPCPLTAPDSIYFLPLSHAPPALPVNIASMIAESVAPIRSPPTNIGPKRKPETSGNRIARTDGTFISFNAPCEDISIHVL